MQPVLHGDVVAAARHLLCVPIKHRSGVMRRMIARADMADEFRRATLRNHRFWGDGTLEAVAVRAHLAYEPFLDDPDYCACMMVVFQALLERVGISRVHRKRRL